MEYTTLAAVDLGSNSFHLAIGRVVDDQVYPLDSLKETVRLGAGLGEDKRLDIDFRRDRVTISQSKGRPAPDGYYTVQAQQRFGGLLIVDARVGRINARAVIDTGAERSLGNPVLESRLQRRANAKALSPRDTEVFGATDAVQSGRSVVSPTITIGNAELSNLEVTFGDLHVFKVWDLESVPAVLLGMDLLGTADHLIIDYRRSELQIKATRAKG